MSLAEYAPMHGPDRFSIAHSVNYKHNGEFAFPCCICDSQDKKDTEMPCRECGHNANYTSETPAPAPPTNHLTEPCLCICGQWLHRVVVRANPGATTVIPCGYCHRGVLRAVSSYPAHSGLKPVDTAGEGGA